MFAQFREAQRRLVSSLCRAPECLTAWLESKRPAVPAKPVRCHVPRSWRTARITSSRREELVGLLERLRTDPACESELIEWLLTALPVSSYLDIAAHFPGAPCPEVEQGVREVTALRERLFGANLGLAKMAAGRRRPDHFGERLSAASAGLLDAIDRYTPGERSARFAYFASYWIRYRLSRHVQKYSCLVKIPVHLRRRVQPENAGGAAPLPPQVISLHQSPAGAAGEELALEGILFDPGPLPSEGTDSRVFDERIRRWLERRLPAEIRVALAYEHGVGVVADAASAYLEELRAKLRERLGLQAGST